MGSGCPEGVLKDSGCLPESALGVALAVSLDGLDVGVWPLLRRALIRAGVSVENRGLGRERLERVEYRRQVLVPR